MSTETMRHATGNLPAARVLGVNAACSYAIPATAALSVRPKHAEIAKQATWVHVTDFGPRPPLRSSP
jgi:hypothetical protein